MRTDRKARGVFYTPRWLAVDIIDKALGHASRTFGAQRLAVLDPACGDGAFTRRLPDTVDVYGVDVDAAAIARAGAGRFVLGDAIVDEPDAGAEGPPVRWHDAFGDVFGAGGFHVVVGNPPYRNVDQAQAGDDAERFAAFKRHIQTFRTDDPRRLSWADHYRRMCDLYHLFMIRGLWALRPGGILAFVTSRTWLEAWYADRLRRRLARETTLLHIVDYGHDAIFEGTQIPAAVVVLAKAPPPSDHRIDVRVGERALSVAQCDLDAAPWRFSAPSGPALGLRLGDLCVLSQGMQTGCNAVFANFTEAALARERIEPDRVRRRAAGGDIRAGALTDKRVRYALWTEDLSEGALPRRAAAWLGKNRARLEARAACRRGDCEWYRWSWPRLFNPQVDRPKILCPYRARANRFWFDAAGEVVGLTDTTVLLPRPDSPVSPAELVTRLNDPEHTARHLAMAKRTGQGLVEYFAGTLAELRITV